MPLDTTDLPPETASFYRRSMRVLREDEIPFLAGGAHALTHYTGIVRHTKDLDLFVHPGDLDRALSSLADLGYETELTFPHWLAKARKGENTIDLIYRSGNGVSEVSESWFERSSKHEVLEVPVQLCPPEELILQKSFIMERERYDGADVAHLLRSCAEKLDWDHLLQCFGAHWRVLLSHLILFGFIYPTERQQIPSTVMDELLQRLQDEEQSTPAEERLCRGTLLSRTQYLIDVEQEGFQDARLKPRGQMTAREIEEWTEAIQEELRPTQ